MGRQLAGKLRLRVGLCLVLFKDESLCSDGNEPVESETSVKGNFGPSAFLCSNIQKTDSGLARLLHLASQTGLDISPWLPSKGPTCSKFQSH